MKEIMGDRELLDLKQKIIIDDEYNNWMKKISKIENEFASSSAFNNKVALDHGIAHMNRVANNTYKLLKEYNINYDTCKLGYIAGLIHDIGMIHGKKEHAENGSEMAKLFLKKLGLIDNIKDIQEIVTAIKNHGNRGKNPNEITSFLTISDKVDICKSQFLGNISPIQYIENYTINIKNGILQIII